MAISIKLSLSKLTFCRIPILWVLIGVIWRENKDSLVKYTQETLGYTKLNEFLYCRITDGTFNKLISYIRILGKYYGKHFSYNLLTQHSFFTAHLLGFNSSPEKMSTYLTGLL